MASLRRLTCCLAIILVGLACARPASATISGSIKIGALKFGTLSWELDVIKRNGFDRAEGIDLKIVEFATNNATSVALHAKNVDIIVTDWLWVNRQRADGARYTFVPYSTSVGALVVPADSPIRSLEDLKGKRLGIAGGPVDKSWLLIRGVAEQRYALDLDASVDKVFGAPPLLNAQIELGRLDGVVNNWNFVANLQAKGFRKLLGAGDAARELGIATDVPLLGYVFDENWAAAHRNDVLSLVRASRKAKLLLAESDAEWERVRRLMAAPDEASFAALRDEFRAGIPRRWGEAERRDAVRLFAVLAKLGGKDLVGDTDEIRPGTFWPEVVY